MKINEVIRTSGDLRRALAQTIGDVRSGAVPVDRGMCVAALANQVNGSLDVEVKVAKVRAEMLKAGQNMGELTHIGKLVIEESGSVPTLDGTVHEQPDGDDAE